MHARTHAHTHARTRTHARAHTHTHTQAPAHTSTLTIQSLIYTQFKTGSKHKLETDEDSSTKRKTQPVCSFGKRNVFRLHLNEPRVDFCRRGRGKSFQEHRPSAVEVTGQCVPDPVLIGDGRKQRHIWPANVEICFLAIFTPARKVPFDYYQLSFFNAHAMVLISILS